MADDITPEQEEREAVKRIGFTQDGTLLHRYLRRILENCRFTDNAGALQRETGARILARDLMAMMAEGIDGGGRDEYRRDKPVLQSTAKPVVANQRRGLRRRVSADDDLGKLNDGPPS